MHFLSISFVLHVPLIPSFIVFSAEYNNEAPHYIIYSSLALPAPSLLRPSIRLSAIFRSILNLYSSVRARN